ncbi:MAG: AGE family epimerase/isomerase, partial [Muribaculaceae bacterium]|nr:AGE family epimerase/isomerase [Muribaculaceae bacterium]
YTNLLRVWDDTELREATTSLLELFFDKIEASGKRGHLGLFFDDDWNRLDSIISYGHDIEASWLLLETAQVLDDKALLDKAMAHTWRIAEGALEGRCSDGSMVYERHESGTYDNDKHWWVQAENVIGQMYLYLFHGREDMLGKAYESWSYIKDYIVDGEGGEWFWSRSNGKVDRTQDKAGFWKCPYHNSRMCLEVYEHLHQ